MASRTKQFFATPSEIAQLLRELRTMKGVHVFVAPLMLGRDVSLANWDGSDEAIESSSQVYCSSWPLEDSSTTRNNAHPPKLGWAYMVVPRFMGNVLTMLTFSAKSQWSEKGSTRLFDNPTSVKLFDSLWRHTKRRISYPTLIEISPKSAPEVCRQVGYTDGAREWFRGGGELQQAGVQSRFLIPNNDS